MRHAAVLPVGVWHLLPLSPPASRSGYRVRPEGHGPLLGLSERGHASGMRSLHRPQGQAHRHRLEVICRTCSRRGVQRVNLIRCCSYSPGCAAETQIYTPNLLPTWRAACEPCKVP
ncbi:hypothetical protein COO60DRAFT_1581399 [Scenedesmus sp. NREL 46B-D3]|nr:hypothetical protein COO60DRAFT_1581399 [Scenedesmus sp. NREL 46B-D3]